MNGLFKVFITKEYLDDYYDHLSRNVDFYTVIVVTADGDFVVTDGKHFAKIEPHECTLYSKLEGALK